MADSISRATVLFRQPDLPAFLPRSWYATRQHQRLPICTVDHTELDIVTVRSFGQSHLSLPTYLYELPEAMPLLSVL